jgi:hypothetical protein
MIRNRLAQVGQRLAAVSQAAAMTILRERGVGRQQSVPLTCRILPGSPVRGTAVCFPRGQRPRSGRQPGWSEAEPRWLGFLEPEIKTIVNRIVAEALPTGVPPV